MICVGSYDEWRQRARELLLAGVPPSDVVWGNSSDAQEMLFEPTPAIVQPAEARLHIPKRFLALAETAARHADASRWGLLYRVVWRLTHGERHLLEIEIDPDIAVLNAMCRAVEKDIYRMRQFVRFRKIPAGEGEQFVSWYEPEHHTLDANGSFFVNRFGSMRWAILTPESSLVWDLERLEHGPGVPRSQAPREDELEDLWRLYYSTIYNPARMKLTAMRAQLPVSRWNNLPEARVIPELVRESRGRVLEMAQAQPRSATEFIPTAAALPELGAALRNCEACDLCRCATGPVFGEGDPHARIMLVGEQPGDEEDLSGRPFVGPAGQVLDAALRDASLPRPSLYITNAVKAFRFEERGKRRIHQTPRNQDIAACRPWLLAEMDTLRPEIIVCMGLTAAQAVLGRRVQIAAERGRAVPQGDTRVFVTYHPSAILRAPDESARQAIYAALVADLQLAAA